MVVKWTDFAWTMLSQTADYVLMEFGYKTYDSFMQDVDGAIASIVANPNLGIEETFLRGKVQIYRSLLVNKHNKIVYEVHEHDGIIYIVDFWETRRDPQLLKASHL